MSEDVQNEDSDLNRLPELEKVCQVCAGEGADRYPFKVCDGCGGAGFVPTPLGERILDLVRHNRHLLRLGW